MKNDIYTLLNDIDHSVDSYHVSAASQRDVKNWKKTVLSHSRRRKHKNQAVKYAAAAAVCLLAAGISFSPFSSLVYAQMKVVTYSLSQLLGIQTDLSPYSTAVGQSISKDGYTITLNDVILDQGNLLVSYTTTSPTAIKTPEEELNLSTDVSVFINGKWAEFGASGSSEKVDDYNEINFREIHLDHIDTSGQLDTELYFSLNQQRAGSISFTASGKELSADTKTVAVNQKITLPDKTEITLEKYTSNQVGQRIYFSAASLPDYDIMLKGFDNLGNPVEFGMRSFYDGIGQMSVETIENGYIPEAAQSLTLQVYAAEMPEESGQMNQEYEAVGEEIVIDLR